MRLQLLRIFELLADSGVISDRWVNLPLHLRRSVVFTAEHTKKKQKSRRKVNALWDRVHPKTDRQTDRTRTGMGAKLVFQWINW